MQVNKTQKWPTIQAHYGQSTDATNGQGAWLATPARRARVGQVSPVIATFSRDEPRPPDDGSSTFARRLAAHRSLCHPHKHRRLFRGLLPHLRPACRRDDPAVILCGLHRIVLAQDENRRGVRGGRLDGLRRFAPPAIEQGGGCRDTSGRSSLGLLGDVDQCGDGQLCVLAGKRDDLRQSFRASARVAGFARREQRA